MLLRTLGGLAIEGIAFRRPKPLLLLAFLALEGPQDRRHLAELFWPHARDHMKSLTVALTQLRKGAPGAVQSDRRRVRSEMDCDAVDLLARLDGGEREAALIRYVGPFLEGFFLPTLGAELEEWIYGTREHLAARTSRAALELAELEAARDRFETAGDMAERALALARGTLEPEALPRLHSLLLATGRAAADGVRAEAETYGVTLLDSPEAALASLVAGRPPNGSPIPTNLPSRGTGFVGRDLELTEVASLLARSETRLLTLLGPAGVGKSRLALQVAREQLRLRTFRHGVYLVALDAVHAPDAIVHAVADGLRIDAAGRTEPLAQVTAAVGEREVLLVCDGVEHLLDGIDVLSCLIAACPGLTLLVTSRERLHLEDERIFPVDGLAMPEVDDLTPEEALRFDAVHLFVRRARRARPGFELRAEDAPSVVRICRLVGGLPLALELAAVCTRTISVQEVEREIHDDLGILSNPGRDAPERHRSVRAAFEHSWRLLRPTERKVLARLAVFQGGFRRDAAAEVAGATIPTLASLVDKSLLRVAGAGRYDRHPLLHQFTREKLAADEGEERDAYVRHMDYVLRLLGSVRELMEAGSEQQAVDLVEAELENVRAALHTSAGAERSTRRDAAGRHSADHARELRLALETLMRFFEAGSRVKDGLGRLRTLRERLAADRPGRRPERLNGP